MSTEIRLYQDSDVNALLAVWEASSRLAHPFMTEAFFGQERRNIPELYLPNAETWVVVQDRTVVGFIALIGNEVGGLFVDPALHGQKLGKALMDKARELHGSLVVEVFKDNTLGRRFYDRYGFQLIEEKVFERTGDVLFRMELAAS
ncbi:GNAT family N-acetyltransferase [Endozoicomonas elysicola]|uniref:Acetyltransferase n=1 Tax=Endozoicomonas elysicola TaxID=305900 RepID=A0A081KA04_9GAMM|nr:GNAT family N-acetyltransferase [Endozoicomonas elysicola]KEI70980.1 acetyltransferase [Endozoicomonas elysicola]